VLGLCLTAGLIYFVYSMGSSLNPAGAANENIVVPLKYTKFAPEVGDLTLFKTKMGDTCSSIFSTKTMFGGKQKGYRVTLLTGRVQFNLICLCDESQFDKMRLAFDQAVKTIHEK